MKGGINIKNITVVFLLILLFALFFYLISFLNKQTAEISLGEKISIEAEIADSGLERSLGLSGRESLDKDRGMLFVFDKNRSPGFWMKDMNFNIDIIWILDDQIVGIEHDVNNIVQDEFYYPPKPINYALEINGGLARQYGLKTGDRVRVVIKPWFSFLALLGILRGGREQDFRKLNE